MYTSDSEILAELIQILVASHHGLQHLRSLAEGVLEEFPEPSDPNYQSAVEAFVMNSIDLAELTNSIAHDSDCMLRYAAHRLPEAFEIATGAPAGADDMPSSPAGLA
ncbi:MAG: hypothetical protein DCC49_01930 [Acidobacteria bacterium]|nr:MAG: hypothetical protein DCC49_01930 [Acidobacteriota bacterium]